MYQVLETPLICYYTQFPAEEYTHSQRLNLSGRLDSNLFKRVVAT